MGRLLQLTDTQFTNPNLPYLNTPTPLVVGRTDLHAWWSADQGITQSALRVSQLNDLSAGGHNLLMATAANQPLLVAGAQNALAGIENDQAQSTQAAVQTLVSAALASGTFEYNVPFSIGLAFKCGPVRYQNEYNLVLADSNANGIILESGTNAAGGSPQLRLQSTSSSTAKLSAKASGVTLVAGQSYSFVFTYDGSGVAAGIKIYQNGLPVTAAVTSDALASATITDAVQSWKILNGVSAGGTVDSSPHTFLEAFVIKRALVAADVAALDIYTNARYAIHS